MRQFCIGCGVELMLGGGVRAALIRADAVAEANKAEIAAHKVDCLEERGRTRELVQELKSDQREIEIRITKSLQEVSLRFATEQATHHVDNQRRFDKIDDQVSKITGKLAGLIAGVAVLGWIVEHFHMLSQVGLH